MNVRRQTGLTVGIMRSLLVLLSLTMVLASCVNAPPNYPYAKEPDPRKVEFVIGVSDQLRIRVWKNPELNTEIQVRPDGTITMPLVGDVKADGLTPSQLTAAITKALAQYVKDESAVVTVAVVEVNSYKVTVSGAVMQPGIYGSRQYLTVADAIALAGGPSRFASPADTVLIRKGPGNTSRRIPINYDQVVRGEFLQQNLVLLAGDVVFVP